MKKNNENKFNTPEGYFESFHDRLMDRIQKEEGGTGSSIPNTDGFTVPGNYFEEVVPTILSKTTAEGGKVIPIGSRRNFYYAAAAVAAIFLLVFGINWKTETTPLGFDDLASAEIDAYFENHEIGLSSYEIAEAIPLEDIQLNDVLAEDLTNDILWEYLEDNMEDIEDLHLENEEHE